jgi:hypothetical protein
VTPARLHRSDSILGFYIYGGTLDNPLRYLLSAYGTVFGALCADEFLFRYIRTTDVLSASVSDWMVCDGDYGLVVYRKVGSITEELILGRRGVFFYLVF